MAAAPRVDDDCDGVAPSPFGQRSKRASLKSDHPQLEVVTARLSVSPDGPVLHEYRVYNRRTFPCGRTRRDDGFAGVCLTVCLGLVLLVAGALGWYAPGRKVRRGLVG